MRATRPVIIIKKPLSAYGAFHLPVPWSSVLCGWVPVLKLSVRQHESCRFNVISQQVQIRQYLYLTPGVANCSITGHCNAAVMGKWNARKERERIEQEMK